MKRKKDKYAKKEVQSKFDRYGFCKPKWEEKAEKKKQERIL